MKKIINEVLILIVMAFGFVSCNDNDNDNNSDNYVFTVEDVYGTAKDADFVYGATLYGYGVTPGFVVKSTNNGMPQKWMVTAVCESNNGVIYLDTVQNFQQQDTECIAEGNKCIFASVGGSTEQTRTYNGSVNYSYSLLFKQEGSNKTIKVTLKQVAYTGILNINYPENTEKIDNITAETWPLSGKETFTYNLDVPEDMSISWSVKKIINVGATINNITKEKGIGRNISFDIDYTGNKYHYVIFELYIGIDNLYENCTGYGKSSITVFRYTE